MRRRVPTLLGGLAIVVVLVQLWTISTTWHNATSLNPAERIPEVIQDVSYTRTNPPPPPPPSTNSPTMKRTAAPTPVVTWLPDEPQSVIRVCAVASNTRQGSILRTNLLGKLGSGRYKYEVRQLGKCPKLWPRVRMVPYVKCCDDLNKVRATIGASELKYDVVVVTGDEYCAVNDGRAHFRQYHGDNVVLDATHARELTFAPISGSSRARGEAERSVALSVHRQLGMWPMRSARRTDDQPFLFDPSLAAGGAPSAFIEPSVAASKRLSAAAAVAKSGAWALRYPLYLPLGPRSEFKAVVSSEVSAASSRRFVFNFVGSLSSPARKQLRKHLEQMGAILGSGGEWAEDAFVKTVGRWHITQKKVDGYITPAEYRTVLLDSVFTLNPQGHNPEAYRIFEALAAGSIPILALTDVHDHNCTNPFRPYFPPAGKGAFVDARYDAPRFGGAPFVWLPVKLRAFICADSTFVHSATN